MESLVISLLLFGVLVFLAWVFVKGIANMEPAGAAAGGFMILILIPVFIIVLIVFLWPHTYLENTFWASHDFTDSRMPSSPGTDVHFKSL